MEPLDILQGYIEGIMYVRIHKHVLSSTYAIYIDHESSM